MSTYRGVNACLAQCLNSVLNVKAVVAAFNQEKDQVGAFSVIVQLHRLIVYSTSLNLHQAKDGMTMNILGVSALAGGSCSCDQCDLLSRNQ